MENAEWLRRELFEFTPLEGVQVMDMTEGAINMIKTMKKPKE